MTIPYPEPSFDSQISGAMRARAERVAVSLDSPVNVAAPPTQLDRWIEAVSDSGGHVYMCRQPTAASGAIIEDLLDWVVKNTVLEVRTLYLMQPAKYYDVFLVTSRNQITTLVFAIRDADSRLDTECKSLLSEFAVAR